MNARLRRGTLLGTSGARIFALLLWLLLAGIPLSTTFAADRFDGVYITEFLAANQHGIVDEDGQRSGWIELYNGGTLAVNLKGWFLTDSKTNLTRWRFPGVTLLPDKYLLVFASGKDRQQDLIRLHTNFKLDAAGGYLALVHRTTNVVSEFGPGYPAQAADVSFGRVRGEPARVGPMSRATPGRHNSVSGPGFGPEVTFSQSSTTFSDPFPLTLSASVANAAIRFTLDGSLPNSDSALYVAPLFLTNSAQIRARAYVDGLFPGPPHSEAFVRLFTNALNFTSTLPVFVMDTFGKDVPASTHGSFVHLSLFEPRGGVTSLTNPPTLTTRAAFHVRGSTSAGMPQSGYAVRLLDEFNGDKAQALLGLPPDSEWILYAPNGYDPVLMHNPLVHQLSRDLGRYSPRTRFVEGFIVRGSGRLRATYYTGLYVLEERIKIGKSRVDIDRLGAEDLAAPQVTGGYLLKFDRLGPGEGGFSAGGSQIVYVDPKEPVITQPQRAAQREYIASYLEEFQRTLYGPRWKDPTHGYRSYLDVDAAIDFHVLEVLSGNVDSIVLSTYFFKPRGGKIVCGPHWDFDRALGSTDGRDDNPRVWSTGPFFGGDWWPRLFRDPDFWQLWVDRWQDLRRSHFSNTNLNALIDRFAYELRDAQPRQYQRWGFQPRGGSYQSELQHLKDWLADRVEFIDRQLSQPPVLKRVGHPQTNGMQLELRMRGSTNATIYYTLDGTDPRRAQGGVASNAVAYAGPISVRGQVKLTARVRDPDRRQLDGPPSSTPWSSPVHAEFESSTP